MPRQHLDHFCTTGLRKLHDTGRARLGGKFVYGENAAKLPNASWKKRVMAGQTIGNLVPGTPQHAGILCRDVCLLEKAACFTHVVAAPISGVVIVGASYQNLEGAQMFRPCRNGD